MPSPRLSIELGGVVSYRTELQRIQGADALKFKAAIGLAARAAFGATRAAAPVDKGDLFRSVKMTQGGGRYVIRAPKLEGKTLRQEKRHWFFSRGRHAALGVLADAGYRERPAPPDWTPRW